jgi:hypothetical protein
VTPEPAFLEWYRVDQGARVRRTLVVGAGAVTVGGLVMGAVFLFHLQESVRNAATLVGIGFIIAGALSTAVGMSRVLADDAYLAVSAAGVELHVGGPPVDLVWADLERIRFDAARGAIVFTRRDGEEVVTSARFAGEDPAALAARLDAMRRKADFGLLR